MNPLPCLNRGGGNIGGRQSPPVWSLSASLNALCQTAVGVFQTEAIGDREGPVTNGVQMVEPFFQAEVAQVIGTEFIAQEAGELLILFQTGVFPVRSENVMTMFDLVEHIGGFSI